MLRLSTGLKAYSKLRSSYNWLFINSKFQRFSTSEKNEYNEKINLPKTEFPMRANVQ